jgi:SSS family solute:Na+ symporter
MSPLDLAVLLAYFLGLTALSHAVRPKSRDAETYYLGGRQLPWPLVSLSIIATSISGVTFIGLPALVFAEAGDLRYLQFALAALLAKGLLGVVLLPRFYAAGVASPYEYLAQRLGPGFGQAGTALFMLGAVLGQGVRVFAVALVLELLTGWSLFWNIALIVGLSAVHMGHGGLRAVVWTDAVQALLLLAGGAYAFLLATADGPGSLSALLTQAEAAGKLRAFDASLNPALSFTLWTALLAMPVQNLAAYGGDQINTQRMLACRNLGAARKALYTSLLGEGITALFLLVGLALWAYYDAHPLSGFFQGAVAEKGDRIFPAFILEVMPEGLRGLLIAAVFAAAMSSLDSVLSALAQVSEKLSGPRGGAGSGPRWVGLWALLLGAFALALSQGGGELVPLAYQMTAFSYPPLLGLLLIAAFGGSEALRWPRLATALAMATVAALLPFTTGFEPRLAFPWLFPLGLGVFLLVAVAPSPRRNPAP